MGIYEHIREAVEGDIREEEEMRVVAIAYFIWLVATVIFLIFNFREK